MLTAEERNIIKESFEKIKCFLKKKCVEEEMNVFCHAENRYLVGIRWNQTNNLFEVEYWKCGSCVQVTDMSMQGLVTLLLYAADSNNDMCCLKCQEDNKMSTCLYPKIHPSLLDEYRNNNINPLNVIGNNEEKNGLYIMRNNIQEYNKTDNVSNKDLVEEEEKEDNIINYYKIYEKTAELIKLLKNDSLVKVEFSTAENNVAKYILYKIQENDYDLISMEDKSIFSGTIEEIINKLMPEIIKGEIII